MEEFDLNFAREIGNGIRADVETVENGPDPMDIDTMSDDVLTDAAMSISPELPEIENPRTHLLSLGSKSLEVGVQSGGEAAGNAVHVQDPERPASKSSSPPYSPPAELPDDIPIIPNTVLPPAPFLPTMTAGLSRFRPLDKCNKCAEIALKGDGELW